ncbi:hypothetical protein F2Q69_00061792 [Brassica cretica]|uniref:Uncharacterized protein n=1 Tax=Brassica cretica TaxID=69181 RepID=A0A3N6QSL4_BRACR|nr:hypothetical protein F2Q69_00061792 [Brassica cretica]
MRREAWESVLIADNFEEGERQWPGRSNVRGGNLGNVFVAANCKEKDGRYHGCI